jgi:HK97 family phage major capsid protein
VLPKLVDLQAARTHKASLLVEILDKAEKDGRVLTAEERALFDRLTGEVNSLDSQIADLQAHQERRQAVQAMGERYAQSSRQTSPDRPANPNAQERPSPRAFRGGRLKAFKGPDAERHAYRAGMWARAVIFNDYRAQEWCVGNGVFDSQVRNALGGNSNASGGYLVPEEFSQAIIDLREQYGVYRRECRVVQMGSDTMTVPRRVGGVSVTFVGENPTSGITESTPSWNQVRLTAKKLAGLVKLSTEIDEDAVVDLAEMLADEFAYEFALKEDQCGFNGDGTSTFGGMTGLTKILTAASSLAGAVDAASGHDTFEEIDAVDLARAMAKLPEYARLNAKWFCSAVAADLVFGRLLAGAGGNTIQTIQGGYQRVYLGYPVVVSQVLPTSTGDLSDLPMILFGDLMKSSTMGSRRGVNVFPSEHRHMELDQIAIRATQRFDIVNHDVGDTSTPGPIVALVGE